MNPILWFRDLLYGTSPAEFASAFGPEDSIERLKSVTVRMILFPTEQIMVGRVNADRVALRRVTPTVHNTWAPVFTGRFEIREGRTVLVGAFKLSRFTKVFMTLWFGFIAFWTGLVTVIAFEAQRDPSAFEVTPGIPPWIFPLFGIGMFLIGVAMVWGGKRWARGDQAWLSDRIARGLGTSPGSAIGAAIE